MLQNVRLGHVLNLADVDKDYIVVWWLGDLTAAEIDSWKLRE